MDNRLAFFEFAYDRQLVWYKKEIQKIPAPWTSDPILQKYSFCNIYRYNDRGTKYIVKSVLERPDFDDETKLFNVVCYRIFNKDQMFDGYIWDKPLDPYTFDWQKEDKFLEEKKKTQTLFNTAYIITQTQPFMEHARPGSKHTQVVLTLDWLAKQIKEFTAKLKSLDDPYKQIDLIDTIPLVGGFLAGQILLDLGYVGISEFTNDDWAVVGPGAELGLNFVFNRDKYTVPYKELMDQLKLLSESQDEYWDLLFQEREKNWDDIASPTVYYWKPPYQPSNRLSLMDLQNTCCEFSKYSKILRGGGRKRYYHGAINALESSNSAGENDGNV